MKSSGFTTAHRIGLDLETHAFALLQKRHDLHREGNVPMSFTDDDGKPYKMDAKDIEIPEKYADLEPFRY